MLFDTDIFIWIQKGNEKAANIVEKSQERFLSVQTYMELIQCSNNKKQVLNTQDFLTAFNFTVLPLSENIGHRALIYIEEYSLSNGIRTGDAIIAATSAENNLTLLSSNAKHFRPIKDLKFKFFKP